MAKLPLPRSLCKSEPTWRCEDHAPHGAGGRIWVGRRRLLGRRPAGDEGRARRRVIGEPGDHPPGVGALVSGGSSSASSGAVHTYANMTRPRSGSRSVSARQPHPRVGPGLTARHRGAARPGDPCRCGQRPLGWRSRPRGGRPAHPDDEPGALRLSRELSPIPDQSRPYSRNMVICLGLMDALVKEGGELFSVTQRSDTPSSQLADAWLASRSNVDPWCHAVLRRADGSRRRPPPCGVRPQVYRGDHYEHTLALDLGNQAGRGPPPPGLTCAPRDVREASTSAGCIVEDGGAPERIASRSGCCSFGLWARSAVSP